MSPNYITSEVLALIGVQSEWVEIYHPVQESEVRRFFQAIMDPNPRSWDEQWAWMILISTVSRARGGPAFPQYQCRSPEY
jgi:hypothetical protein